VAVAGIVVEQMNPVLIQGVHVIMGMGIVMVCGIMDVRRI
jgi:hypothetical protein